MEGSSSGDPQKNIKSQGSENVTPVESKKPKTVKKSVVQYPITPMPLEIGSENLAPPINTNPETDKTSAIQLPLTHLLLETSKVSTDADLKALKRKNFWEWMSDDKVRLLITILFISLFLISFVGGFILLIVTGNGLLFGAFPVLLIPTLTVLRYWFYPPKTK